MSFQQLAGRIDELGTTPFAGNAFRHVSPNTDPRSGAGARIHGGRWNPPESYAVVYLGLDQAAVVAEFHRSALRQRVPVDGFLPRELYRFEVRLQSVVDLRPATARTSLHLSDAELRADDPSACRSVGAAAHHLGIEGILAPSATSAGTVLAVFADNLLPESLLEVAALEAVWEEPPDLPEASR